MTKYGKGQFIRLQPTEPQALPVPDIDLSRFETDGIYLTNVRDSITQLNEGTQVYGFALGVLYNKFEGALIFIPFTTPTNLVGSIREDL